MDHLKHKIAIVEDSKLMGSLVSWELSQNPNYQVEWFATGEDFFNQERFQPDLIILDYELNGKVAYAANGLEIINRLQETPVIVISAQKNIQIAIDFIRKGVCDYVVKDSNITRTISKSVKEVLSHKESKEQMARCSQSKRTDLGRIGLFLIACVLIGLSYQLLS